MVFKFKDWFFTQFPDWHQNNDVNLLDINKEGTFKRYLRIYGMELDENVIPYIENFLDIIDVQRAEDKYLPLIAQILGTPPSIGDNDSYRKVLSYIVAIYKIKGTKKSFEIFFNLLGLNISIIEATPRQKITYDMDNVAYDDDPIEEYDSECEYCSKFQIAYSSIDDTTNPFSYHVVDPAVLDKVNNIICFLQPINAKFDGLIRGMNFRDEHNPVMTGVINIGSGAAIITDGEF